MMKIAVPIHSFEPGGVERVGLNLCAAWQALGDEVTVVLGRTDGAMRETAPALEHWLVPEPFPTAAVETPWLIRVLHRYLRHNSADVIFAAGNTYAIVAVAMKLLLGRRCPPVAIKLSNDLYRKDMIAPYRAAYHWWLRVQGGLLDHCVGMAQPMRAEIAELMRVPDEKITIIEDPSLGEAQFAALSALPRPPRTGLAPHFVAVGRLAPQKNFPLLLRAFARLDDPAALLTILGEGPDRPRLERLALELGIADRLNLPGHVADTLPTLARASAFVLSSDYEGVPAVVIEALAAGLPTVATRCSVSLPGLLGDGAFGQLVDVGDVAGFAAAMRSVRDMPFDPAAARCAAAPFRISQAASRYRAVFAKLVANR
ncbi:MAG: glycosyltransferase [Sphingomonadales bacterium]|nr:glycosyltransferase [Sphingomonadales bacterium]